MADIIVKLKELAVKSPRRIVFPEGDDLRILKACRIIRDEGIAYPVILGSGAMALMEKEGISVEGLEFVDVSSVDFDFYISLLLEKRKHKGLSKSDAEALLGDVNYLGALMVESGFVDAMISGASHPTSSVLRPALQIVGTRVGVKTASSFFLVSKDDLNYFFSDCAFVIDPDASQLKDIAISTARSAERLGFEPRVALLSFSSLGSAKHESISKIVDALALIKKDEPSLLVDGELQLDAAIDEGVASLKCPNSPLKGRANVLIFPDLNSGNIGYKLVERLGHFRAIGPIVQGLKKPINDLSRGCCIEDIVNVAVLTVLEVDE